jgi:antitoxin FitA
MRYRRRLVSTLTVRNLDDALKTRLRVRAAENGRSMEAEARAILRATLDSDDQAGAGLGTRIRDRFAGRGEGLQIAPRKDKPRAADLRS